MMRNLFFGFVFTVFSSFNIYTQELGISVDQLLNLKRDSIERTSGEDQLINRRYFVFRHHPDDPNYVMLYTQNYEEEYFFINNKLYFIVKEYRAVENRWKFDLAGFINKYGQSPENSYTTPDGSWFINEITFSNDIEQYQVFIYRPSQRWNTVYKFAPGEAIVRIIGRHFQYLREYQNANSARESAVNNAIKQKELLSPYFDGIPINLNLSQLVSRLRGLGYTRSSYETSSNVIMFFEKNYNNMKLTWQITTTENSIIKDDGIFLRVSFPNINRERAEELAESLFLEISEKINNIANVQYTDRTELIPSQRHYRGIGIEYFGLNEISLDLSVSNYREEFFIGMSFR